MARPGFPGGKRRKSSTLHYQTLPLNPPTSRGRPPSSPSTPSSYGPDGRNGEGSPAGAHHESPLPVRQLAVLAVIALSEQTALNSISPYLPEMASTFPGVDPSQVGLDVGTIASCFALAQFATGFLWGWLSDHVGRKPVILLGTLCTAACFVAFGFCTTFWQAALVQGLMGFFNGNQGVVSTCLGEITDRSNQSRAFTYLPVIYGLGAITGPIIGGLLVSAHRGTSGPLSRYPYLLPNLFSAALLMVDLVVIMIFLEESLEEARDLPPLGKRVRSLFAWLWQFTSSARPTYLRLPASDSEHSAGHDRTSLDIIDEADLEEAGERESDHASVTSMPTLFPHQSVELDAKQVFHRDTILLLASYLIFQLCNVSFNSLYPIFASSPPPTGRDLSPRVIGISLAFAGAVTILFQVGVFGKFRDALGNRATYRIAFAGFAVAFLVMPWVGYKDSFGEARRWQGRMFLWTELGLVLLVKTIAAVGGLTSALLLITNSAPNHNVLGTLNGLAQTLSAAGRAVGPFLSGGLFSLATNVKPKGEALAWGVFGGIAFVGLCVSFGIRSASLEASAPGGEDEAVARGNDDDDDDDRSQHAPGMDTPAHSGDDPAK